MHTKYVVIFDLIEIVCRWQHNKQKIIVLDFLFVSFLKSMQSCAKTKELYWISFLYHFNEYSHVQIKGFYVKSNIIMNNE